MESSMPRTQARARHRSRFPLTTWEDSTVPTSSNYLVKGILPRTGLGVVWGPPKCGKSFWTFDLVMHVALARDYRGHKVAPGIVVYCALEGGHGFTNRIVAWRQRCLNGHDRAVPFYLMAEPLNLIADVKQLIADIDNQLGGDRPAIIIIDTLNRALIGDENKSDDMAKFIRAMDAVRTTFDCLVLTVHHCGIVGSRPRGHTSLSGADDVQIAIERGKDGTISAKIEHMKKARPAPCSPASSTASCSARTTMATRYRPASSYRAKQARPAPPDRSCRKPTNSPSTR
jgi:hypothetical protein